ncbi:hypothetical protein ACIPYS_25085 [Kitasatospora sp. NPDC089913]|uniref:hypothetical protein n=1 Tax=Streptomycetaceae TaxID=2062 RepID=UPI0008796377|nr:hypothetical protein [Streptomyces sp. TLI_053]SDT82430.1 hypothetical protein SAMN05216371_7215 [Streptomyces sp. TLI_053]
MAYQYTVVTPHGDVHLDSEHHHSAFDTIEDFLKHHKETLTTAVGVATLAVNALGLYHSYNRAGARLR